MQEKIKLVFFIEIFIYIALLIGLPYVSVYITYFAIPIIIITGVLGFVNFNSSLNNIAKLIFIGTLILWIITLATVSYVGVYLIWIVAPVLAISGAMWFFTKTKKLDI